MKTQSLIITMLALTTSTLCIALVLCMICLKKKSRKIVDLTECSDTEFVDECEPGGDPA